MSRIARVVIPEVPNHVTQRGNCRLQTFFCDEDYKTYRDLMSQWCTHWTLKYGPLPDVKPCTPDCSFAF
ncbi:MAG: hypothetical protein HUU08_15950 [Candidatus Brocadia sp.]|nr:hypothetical protein [Candidatus Brocadia sp.]UJS15941.1 MAG: hypothetical protein L3J17_08405 [Candidatus Jettenia sp.]